MEIHSILFRLKIDKYHEIDHKIDRTSFTGQYYVDPVTNRPQNPRGRTGSRAKDFIVKYEI